MVSKDLVDDDGVEAVLVVDEDPAIARVQDRVFGIGDVVRAPQMPENGSDGPEETLRLLELTDVGWRVTLPNSPSAKVRPRKDGWIVEQPRRKKPSQWFGYSKC